MMLLLLGMILTIIVMKVFLSRDDEIPNEPPLPPLRIKQNFTYIRAQHAPLTLNVPAPTETLKRQTLKQSFIQQQQFTRFEQMFEYPNLVSFEDLERHYDFGFDPNHPLHYGMCVFVFTWILLFRVVLGCFEILGQITVHLFIRFLFEGVIRGVFILIRGFFHYLGHVLDGH